MKISFLNYTKSKKNNNNVLLCTLKYNLAKTIKFCKYNDFLFN